MDTRVWDKVGLELGDVHVESAIESKRRSQRGDDLTNETVEVGVSWALNVEVATANVVQGLVVDLHGDISVLKQGVHAEHSVVRLHHCSGHLRATPHCETDLGLLAIINRETLEEQASKTGASAATASVVDNKALQTSAVVSKLTQTIQDQVNNILSYRLVATSEVVGSIYLTREQLLWVEQLTVGASTDFINHGWLEVNVHTTRHVLSCTGLGEECVECIIASTNGLVRGHLAIRLNSVLQAEQLPARISNLATGLTHVDADTLTHVVGGLVLQ
jgi:hypothetical protein